MRAKESLYNLGYKISRILHVCFNLLNINNKIYIDNIFKYVKMDGNAHTRKAHRGRCNSAI